MEDFELTKKPDLDIFDRQFPARLESDPIYDPTKMTIIQGTDGILDDLFSYQVYNKLKNHWRLDVVPTDIQPGMIWSDSDDDKLYHHGNVGGAADDEILQLTRSSDVTPEFLGLLLAEYITHDGDADTYFRLETDKISIRAGGIDLVNIGGKVFINDALNADMTIGLTINQGANNDEILAFKASGIIHGITDEAETDTYGTIKKFGSASGGVSLRGYGEDEKGIELYSVHTVDETTKSAAGRASVEISVFKKSGTGTGAPGADANLVAIRKQTSAVWILDEDGDTWQLGAMHRLALGPVSELTIAAGVITVTGSYHTVDTQDNDAADDLDTINGGIDGQILVLRTENNAHDVTVKDGADNIQLLGGDFVMGSTTRKLYLFYDANETNWLEIARH